MSPEKLTDVEISVRDGREAQLTLLCSFAVFTTSRKVPAASRDQQCSRGGTLSTVLQQKERVIGGGTGARLSFAEEAEACLRLPGHATLQRHCRSLSPKIPSCSFICSRRIT